MSDYNKGLFSDWVPKPVQLLLIVIFTLMILAINTVYTGNISMMTGSLGTMTEYMLVANYAATIGMSASMPLILRVKMRFRVKEILTVSYIVMALMSWVTATTDSPQIVIAASFVFGFVKTFAMMEFMLPLMFLIGNGNRGIFYSVFYPFAIAVGNLSGYVATKIAVQSSWQYANIYTVAAILVMLALTAIFVHNKRFSRKMPLSQIDWLSIMLFTLTFLSLSYFFSFGKIYNWFQTKEIRWSFVAMLVSFILLTLRQIFLKRPYLSYVIFTKNNVQNGMFLLLGIGMFLGSTLIQNIYTTGVLGYDVLTNASLNLMQIPGNVLAGFVAARWFKNGQNPKMMIFLGFAAFTMYTVILYFMMVPELNYERWWLPMILRGFAISALYITVWYYTLNKLEVEQMMQAIGLVLTFRSVVSVTIFSSFFLWLQYDFQWQSVNDLAVYFDGNLLSVQNALGNLKNFQINAVLSANKKVFGLISIAGFGIMIFVLQHHFDQIRYITLRWTRRRVYHALDYNNLSIDRHRNRLRRQKDRDQQ
ncbi:MFS transporter [Chryseobacterium taklimakanense]|uniref:MFS transporter n=1 Tax=Chryseobacterium taklimakanense TaxID=536441 RepID=UPI000F5FDB46|nr:MFS transporter [Chryseobacterium taklimakanense]AZI22674.1 MFS transporter [Chryseobacterium taklimakanense]